jgi:hypothetical protein
MVFQRLWLALRFKIPRWTGDEAKGQDLPRRKRSRERRWTRRAPTPREYMTPSFLLLFLCQASRRREPEEQQYRSGLRLSTGRNPKCQSGSRPRFVMVLWPFRAVGVVFISRNQGLLSCFPRLTPRPHLTEFNFSFTSGPHLELSC